MQVLFMNSDIGQLAGICSQATTFATKTLDCFYLHSDLVHRIYVTYFSDKRIKVQKCGRPREERKRETFKINH